MAKAAANPFDNPLNLYGFMLMLVLPWSGWFHTSTATAGLFGLVNMLLMFGLAFAALAIQQTVVAIAARSLGDHVLMFAIGVGPKLWSRVIRGRMVVVRAVPVNSVHALVTTRAHRQRLRTALAITAGWLPFAIGFAAVLAFHRASWRENYAVLARRPAPDVLLLFIALWIAANGVLMSLGTLRDIRGVVTFDESILKKRRLLGHALDCELQLAKGAFVQAVAAARRGLEEDADDVLLQMHLAVGLGALGDPEAFAITESWSKRDVSTELRAGCLNVRAWECYMRGDDALRAEADAASLEAVSAKPDDASILDTRGHVLLWNNRPGEAEQHLRRSFELAKASSTRACAAAGMAILCANANRLDEAVAWLARARASNVQNLVVRRAAALIDPLRRF